MRASVVFPTRLTPASHTMDRLRQPCSIRCSQNGLIFMKGYFPHGRPNVKHIFTRFRGTPYPTRELAWGDAVDMAQRPGGGDRYPAPHRPVGTPATGDVLLRGKPGTETGQGRREEWRGATGRRRGRRGGRSRA